MGARGAGEGGGEMSLEEERAARREREERKQREAAEEVCLALLRENPGADYLAALAAVEERVGWAGSKENFAKGPWRSAKIRERKERTGRGMVVGPTPPPGPAPAVGDVLLAHHSPIGQLTVRREGSSSFRIIFSASLRDRETAERIMSILTGILHDGALG